jgi:hypothetical protein
VAPFPEPQPGLVISYAYLWAEESEQGLVEGRKDRPCAIVLALETFERGQRPRVAVAPITHTPPRDSSAALEIPPRVKAHLGLDAERSWVILDEFNVFTWPGFDLRPITGKSGRVDYGFLPPKLFKRMIEQIEELGSPGRIAQTSRDE